MTATSAPAGYRCAATTLFSISGQEPDAFESLHLWLSSQPRPFGALAIEREATAGLLDPQDRFTCPTLLTDDSLAYLAMRKNDDTTWQLGAHGFGPHADTLSTDLHDLIVTWDCDYRHGSGPEITVHAADPPPTEPDQLRLTVTRRHTTILITWPAQGRPR